VLEETVRMLRTGKGRVFAANAECAGKPSARSDTCQVARVWIMWTCSRQVAIVAATREAVFHCHKTLFVASAGPNTTSG